MISTAGGAALGGGLGAATAGIGSMFALPLAGLFGGGNYGPDYFQNLLSNSLIQSKGSNPSGQKTADPPLTLPDWAKNGIGDSIMKAIGGILGGGSNNQTGTDNLMVEDLLKTLGLTGINLFGALQQQNQNDWFKNSAVDLLNYYRGIGGSAQNQIGGIQDAYLPQILGQLPYFQNLMQGQQQDLAGRLGNAQNFLGQAFMTPTDTSRAPGLQDVMNFTGGVAGAGTDILRMLGQNLAGGGGLGQGMNVANLLSQGQGGDFDAMRGVGSQLTGAGGQTPFTQMLQGAGMSTLNNRGFTPELRQIMEQARGLFAPDPSTAQASAASMNILGKNPLLPMDQVVGMARTQAATDAGNELEALRKQLWQRTGLAGGPAVAGGGANELLKQLGDDALEDVSRAGMEAQMAQQGLQLQQFGLGSDLYTKAQQGLLGRQNLGFDTLLNATGQAQGRETGIPGLSLGGGQLDLSRLLGGANLFGDTLDSQLKALSTLGGLAGTQQQGFGQAAGLLNALNNLAGTQQQNVFGLQDLGLRAGNNLFSALTPLLQMQGDLAQMGQQGMFNVGSLGNTSQGNWMQLFSDMARSQAGLFGTPAQSSPFGNFLNNISSGIFGNRK